jgi:hypothetical protein
MFLSRRAVRTAWQIEPSQAFGWNKKQKPNALKIDCVYFPLRKLFQHGKQRVATFPVCVVASDAFQATNCVP